MKEHMSMPEKYPHVPHELLLNEEVQTIHQEEKTVEKKESSPCEKIVTHNGLFHFDELKAIAILKKIYPEAEIVRTRDKKILEEAELNPKVITVDVGEKYDMGKDSYDHHQKDFIKKRESSGIKYASAGLIWENYGHQYLQKLFEEKGVKLEAETLTNVWKYIDRKWMEIIDAMDTGELSESEVTINGEVRSGFDYSFNGAIRASHPVFDIDGGKPEVIEGQFQESLKSTQDLLDRLTIHAIEAIRTIKEIQEKAVLIEDEKIMVLEENLKWKEAIHLFPKVEYAVVKSGKDRWSVMTAPISAESRKMRNGVGFPVEMRDYKGKTFGSVQPEDIITFQQAGYLAMTKSKESAENLAKYALHYSKESGNL